MRRILLFLTAIALIIAVIVQMTRNSNGSAPTNEADSVRTAQIIKELDKCDGDTGCYCGGFVVYPEDALRHRSRILQINPCDLNCAHHEIGAGTLFIHRDDVSYLSKFSEIVLPHNRARWERVAVEYAEQFVMEQ